MRVICALEREFLVEGRGQFNVRSELESLEVNVSHTSPFICRGCIQKLKKRRGLINQLDSINSCIKNLHRVNLEDITPQLKRNTCDFHDNTSNTIAKKICKDAKESTPTILQPSTSSPIHHTEIPQWPVSPLVSNEQPKTESVRQPLVLDDELSDKLNDESLEPKRVEVFCKVKWPSKNKERKLPENFEDLGKMLVRGTYKQIANAAWKNENIKKELTVLIAKDIDNECIQLYPSCLRKTNKESLLSFTMEKLYDELRERAPVFHSVLSAAGVDPKHHRMKLYMLQQQWQLLFVCGTDQNS